MIEKTNKNKQWIILLLLFYFFGLLGISLEITRGYFLPLTPLNLLITLFVFLKVTDNFNKKFILLSTIIFLVGFSVEAVGVATGVLFGSYSYGDAFGPKIFETPLLIGVNWLFLAFSSYGIVQYFTKKTFFLICIPALLMTGLDFLVEPIAIKLGFWNWENNVIPLQNYVMWFVTSICIHSIIYLFKPALNTKISFIVFAAQLFFFGILNLVL
ncbi:carotenoid biosynthesis protein [Polaribacter tangerinus]|uniref:carotenoid biosynthesis protein n=1 Tax=Polaribacter tangerinus TaxID=1920034 RepID=UPI000B4AFD03|nr:carotenoid biosynthesis protein [Polaribacter tangerinus]